MKKNLILSSLIVIVALSLSSFTPTKHNLVSKQDLNVKTSTNLAMPNLGSVSVATYDDGNGKKVKFHYSVDGGDTSLYTVVEIDGYAGVCITDGYFVADAFGVTVFDLSVDYFSPAGNGTLIVPAGYYPYSL